MTADRAALVRSLIETYHKEEGGFDGMSAVFDLIRAETLEEAAGEIEAQRLVWDKGTTVHAQLTKAADRLRALKEKA